MINFSTTKVDFGAAITALKSGKCVQRKGWNGKNMWLALWTAGTYLASSELFENAPAICAYLNENVRSKSGDVGASIVMKTADGSLVFGWLASQTDMLAEDWVVSE